MITEIGIGAIFAGIAKSMLTNKKKSEVQKTWNLTMQRMGLENQLLKIIPTKFGFEAIISLPHGDSPKDFIGKKDKLEASFGCYVELEWLRFKHCYYGRFVQFPFTNFVPFQPVETQPYEMYVGTTYSCRDIISDLKIHPHILICGTTGVGKTTQLFICLSNLIANFHGTDKVHVYLAQFSFKQDLLFFKNIPMVKYYAHKWEDGVKLYQYIASEVSRRNDMFTKIPFCKDVFVYNQRVPKNKRLPIVYLFTDEYSLYAPKSTDDVATIAFKAHCQACLDRIATESRSAGIYLVCGLQRPDKESMPPPFKTLLCTRIAYAQVNDASSLVAIDNTSATDLEYREAICKLGNKDYKYKSFYYDDDMVEAFVKKYETEDTSHIKNLDHYNNLVESIRKQAIAQAQKSKSKKYKQIEEIVQEVPLIKEVETANDEVAVVKENVIKLPSKGGVIEDVDAKR